MPIYVGIDLGTTNSCAAVSDGASATVVRSAQGGHLTPSVVRIDARSNVLVGARARRYLSTDPDNTRAEFKRLMGTEHKLAFAAAHLERTPEELSALVLGALRADVERQIGAAPEQAVITVPALFELPQSRATADAARMAGFSRVELIQEPVASALAAGWGTQEDGSWLVYDLGGGTFDVSLLEPQDGLLRVVGHDGDNFLGGRDMDAGLLEWALGELASQGIRVDPKDRAAAAGLRRLRLACEEAKLDASETESDLTIVAQAISFGGEPVDLDLLVPRAVFDAIVDRVAARSLDVCDRLLTRHGMPHDQLRRVVLVGGPTMMPLLRRRVEERLRAQIAGTLDPMTLVAEGAALFAATSDLPALPKVAPAAAPVGAVELWLQYPAVTGDLAPYVVGKVVSEKDRANVEAVVIRRSGGKEAWTSTPEPLDADGAFAVAVSLEARASTELTFELVPRKGAAPLAARPASITIRHGITIGDPPLSRSIGVAREDGAVHTFFERGAPLPTKRTHTLSTAVPLSPQAETALVIPIVQGEFPFAHLCRPVGRLTIAGRDLPHLVPPGTAVEIALSLDAAGALRASARIQGVSRVFDEVAQLTSAPTSSAGVRELAAKARRRVEEMYAKGDDDTRKVLGELDASFDEIERWADLGEGGDADALERARRRALEVEEELHALEHRRAWPELAEECEKTQWYATLWVGRHGTPTEKRTLEQALDTLNRAFRARDAAGVKRSLSFVEGLADTCYTRDDRAWPAELEYYASRVHEAFDMRAALSAIATGREAVKRGDLDGVRKAALEVRALMPSSERERAKNLGSGVR